MAVQPTTIAFRFHAWRRALGNFSVLKHRHCDGHLVSMHQSGTHWLKFMLANALSYQYDIPEPEFNHANDIIGGPRDRPRYTNIPRLISSHSIPHPLLALRGLDQLIDLPHYFVLVRDLRAALESNYAKWGTQYGVNFATYLEGQLRGKRYNSDIWWAFRFLNGWGAVMAGQPQRATVLRYEQLREDPLRNLEVVNQRLGLALSQAALAHAVAVSGKAQMAAKDDPARPPGAVRASPGDAAHQFTASERERLAALCRQYLRYSFGYEYS